MSDITNVIAKQKQIYHNAGATSNAVSDAVESVNKFFVSVKLPTYSDGNTSVTAANDSVVTTVPVNAKLTSAYLTATNTITSTATDTVIVTVACNGVANCAVFNSDALSAATGVNSVTALTMNTVNSYVDAGEAILIAYTMEDNTNNYLEGELVLGFDRQ